MALIGVVDRRGHFRPFGGIEHSVHCLFSRFGNFCAYNNNVTRTCSIMVVTSLLGYVMIVMMYLYVALIVFQHKTLSEQRATSRYKVAAAGSVPLLTLR